MIRQITKSDYKMFCIELPTTPETMFNESQNESCLDTFCFKTIRYNSKCMHINPYGGVPYNFICKFEDKEYDCMLKEKLKKVDVSSHCPYFCEHYLKDWNKSK